jgi:hypothetical protein
LLRPFLGHVTTNSIKNWLHLESENPEVYVTLHLGKVDAEIAAASRLTLEAAMP